MKDVQGVLDLQLVREAPTFTPQKDLTAIDWPAHARKGSAPGIPSKILFGPAEGLLS